jgi:hypothetical protein
MKAPDLKLIFATCLVLSACNTRPKVIEGEPVAGQPPNPVQQVMPSEGVQLDTTTEHLVEVKEFQHSDKYSYLHVQEHQDSFWIIIPKRAVAVGEKYAYRGGLLTKHFHNQQSDQVFETVYLVAEVMLVDDEGSSNALTSSKSSSANDQEIGTVKLAELYGNPHKFEGKKVKVQGTCTKVNNMILNRNWIHIEDDSGDDLNLTITTNENISVGSEVYMEGTVALNKDFGSGYRYDIILEEAVSR